MTYRSFTFLLRLAAASRDQAGGALCSATVPRPSGSSLMSLRRARRRPDLAKRVETSPLHTHHARRPGAWGEWRSEIKEEAAGRRTFAELLTPSAWAYKSSRPFGVMNFKPISSNTIAKQ